jgi:hypothetical protein
MLERTYSRHIGDHSDALARATLFDTEAMPHGNPVTPEGDRAAGQSLRA